MKIFVISNKNRPCAGAWRRRTKVVMCSELKGSKQGHLYIIAEIKPVSRDSLPALQLVSYNYMTANFKSPSWRFEVTLPSQSMIWKYFAYCTTEKKNRHFYFNRCLIESNFMQIYRSIRRHKNYLFPHNNHAMLLNIQFIFQVSTPQTGITFDPIWNMWCKYSWILILTKGFIIIFISLVNIISFTCEQIQTKSPI